MARGGGTLNVRGANQHTGGGGWLDIQVDVSGLKEMSKALRYMKDKELSDAMRDAANAWATLVAGAAKQNLYAHTSGSGRLAKAIRPASTRTIARVRVTGGKKAFYRWMVHSGHRTRSPSKMVAPVPYLRDAVSDTWREGIKRWETKLDDVIKRFNRRYGGGRPE